MPSTPPESGETLKYILAAVAPIAGAVAAWIKLRAKKGEAPLPPFKVLKDAMETVVEAHKKVIELQKRAIAKLETRIVDLESKCELLMDENKKLHKEIAEVRAARE